MLRMLGKRKTVEDLGKLKKREYPGDYDDMTDEELGLLFQKENPGKYDNYRLPLDETSQTVQKIRKTRQSGITNLINLGQAALSVTSHPAAKYGVAPAAEAIGDEAAKSRIKKRVEESSFAGGKPLLAGDVLEELYPKVLKEGGLADVSASIPTGMGVLPFSPKTGVRLAADIGLDPISWLRFGGKTVLGEVVGRASALIKEGKSIQLNSKLARDMAKVLGHAKPSMKTIQEFKRTYITGAPEVTRALGEARDIINAGDKVDLSSKLAKKIGKLMNEPNVTEETIHNFMRQNAKGLLPTTMAEEVGKGHRSLVGLTAPFTDIKGPGITGKAAGRILEPLSALRRGEQGARLEAGIRDLLSTKSGNADYDVLASRYRDLVFSRYSGEIKEGKHLRQQLEDIARETGKPIEEINREITNLVESVRPFSGKKLYPKASIRNLIEASYRDKMIDAQIEVKDLKNRFNAAASRRDDMLMKDLDTQISQRTKDIAEYQGLINETTGKYSPPPVIDPRMAAIAKQLREKSHARLMDEIAAGVKIKPELSDIDYMAGVLTPKARDRIFKVSGMTGKKYTQKEMSEFLAHSIRRQFVEVKPKVVDAWAEADLVSKAEARVLKGKHGLDKMDRLLESGRITEDQFSNAVHAMTKEEVNALGQAGKVPIFGKEPIDQIFHTDPVYSTTVRGMRGAKAQTGAEFFNEVKARGIAKPDIQAEIENPSWVNVKQPELKGYRVPPEVARVMNRQYDVLTNPTELNRFFRHYDRFHSLMKIWTLAPFPAYHIKNMVGNFWNNFLADVNPLNYEAARRTQFNQSVKFKSPLGEAWNTEELVKAARANGVIDKGFYAADPQTTIKHALEKGTWNLLNPTTRNRGLRLGIKIGSGIENNARMAHFIDRLKKGDTVEQAAMSVKKYLFDYSDLTNFERNVLNRGLFFYTWTRKNIPLQLQALVHQPWKFGLPYKARHEIEKGAAIDEDVEKNLPTYVKENFPLRIRKNKDGSYEYFMLGNWLPAADIVKLGHIHDVAANMLAPIPKQLIEQLWNYNLFTHKPIEAYEGQTKKFLRMELPARGVHAAKAIRLLSEMDKMTKEDASLFNKIVGISTGKNYTFNPTEEMISNVRDVSGKVNELKGKMRYASPKQRKNILNLIQKKVKEY